MAEKEVVILNKAELKAMNLRYTIGLINNKNTEEDTLNIKFIPVIAECTQQIASILRGFVRDNQTKVIFLDNKPIGVYEARDYFYNLCGALFTEQLFIKLIDTLTVYTYREQDYFVFKDLTKQIQKLSGDYKDIIRVTKDAPKTNAPINRYNDNFKDKKLHSIILSDLVL